MLARRIADAEERRTVERIYDELLATGTVRQNLSEDDRTVRDLHAEEVLASRAPQPEASKVFPFKPRERVVTRIEQPSAPRAGRCRTPAADVIPLRGSAGAPVAAPVPVPAAAAVAALRQRRPNYAASSDRVASVGRGVRTDRCAAVASARRTCRDWPAAAIAAPVRGTSNPAEEPEREEVAVAARGGPRFYLTLDHDVVDGPSIGAKTAERL